MEDVEIHKMSEGKSMNAATMAEVCSLLRGVLLGAEERTGPHVACACACVRVKLGVSHQSALASASTHKYTHTH